MNWLDVCGPPGSGKSTLCDPLWSPHELSIENRLPPIEWHDFLNEITRLFLLIQKHWSFVPAVRMNNRSIRKIATVAREPVSPVIMTRLADGDYHPVSRVPYIQTALVQRGLGFGWRLKQLGIDLNELRHYYRLMPVSIGVAVTRCPQEIIIQRNHDREKVKATAHENRDFMVPLMEPAIEIALEALHDRGIPICEISTEQPVELARQQLIDFANREPFDAEASGHGREMAPVLSPPPWWQ